MPQESGSPAIESVPPPPDTSYRPTPAMRGALDGLTSWWSSEPQGFRELVLRILASLPGSEALDDVVEPLPLGWHEVQLLGDLLQALECGGDVEATVRAILAEEREEEAPSP